MKARARLCALLLTQAALTPSALACDVDSAALAQRQRPWTDLRTAAGARTVPCGTAPAGLVSTHCEVIGAAPAVVAARLAEAYDSRVEVAGQVRTVKVPDPLLGLWRGEQASVQAHPGGSLVSWGRRERPVVLEQVVAQLGPVLRAEEGRLRAGARLPEPRSCLGALRGGADFAFQSCQIELAALSPTPRAQLRFTLRRSADASLRPGVPHVFQGVTDCGPALFPLPQP